MIDILANFDWKQPIYFTGGAFADEEYIWLKDYLQLDGMAYKLVPIKTPMTITNADGTLSQKSPFDMGRIDPEGMYKKIKKLWKKADNKDYYVIAKRIGSNIEKTSRRGAEYIYCWKKKY